MNPKILYDHYIMREFTVREIAEKFGTTYYKVYYQLNKYGMPLQPRPTDNTKQRTTPWIGQHFLKKVGDYYYPLKGGVKMKDVEITLLVHDEDGVLIYKRESFSVEVIEKCLVDVEKLLADKEQSDERTAEELTDESIQQDIESGN